MDYMFHGGCGWVSRVLNPQHMIQLGRCRWSRLLESLEYRCEKFGISNRVERFFRQLKERTKRPYTSNKKTKTIPVNENA